MTTQPSLIGDQAAPYALLQQKVSSFNGLFPNIVMEEIHHDTLVITKHPVMNGCPVSDHAYKVPPTVQMKIGYSDSSVGQVGYADAQYAALIALQSSLQPFDVYTSKRAYSNMLVANILVVTDKHSFNILNAVVTFEYVRIPGQATTTLTLAPTMTTPVNALGEVSPTLSTATAPSNVTG